jgi:ABC-type dipeptide/oligopeptide/nickel transport system permease subunit
VVPGPRFSPVTWFLNNAKWHGAEWWITIFGGVLLVAIILMTLFADRLSPYDPIKFVGAPFNRPGAQQSVVVLEANNSTQGVADLPGLSVGVVTNSQAGMELDKLGIPYEKYSSIRPAVEALGNGEIEALVTDAKDPKYKKQVREQGVSVKTVGDPFGDRFALGTDNYGRDVLSRIISGARTVLGIAILAALMSAGVGIPLGLLSGFVGSSPDRVLSLVMDSIYSFPGE